MLDEILPEIVDRAREVFELQGEPEIRRIDTRRYSYSEVSRIELVSEGDTRVVYLKRATVENTDEDSIKSDIAAEYRILDELYERFRSVPNLSVVRPVVLLSRYNVIVTEEAPGPTLMTLVGRAVRRISPASVVEAAAGYCGLAGRWLRHFQNVTDRGPGEFDIDGLLCHCDVRLKSLMASGRTDVGAGFRDAVLRHLKTLAESVEPGANTIAGRHNDYSPHNIIASGGGITVFDFGFFDTDSFAYDVYRFWHHLECMKVSPIMSRRKVARLQESFLVGYGRSVDFATPVFRLAACRFNLVRLHTLAKNPAAAGPRGWIDRRLIARCYAWLAHECGPI